MRIPKSCVSRLQLLNRFCDAKDGGMVLVGTFEGNDIFVDDMELGIAIARDMRTTEGAKILDRLYRAKVKERMKERKEKEKRDEKESKRNEEGTEQDSENESRDGETDQEKGIQQTEDERGES